jgi:glycosyltransferase involved in cell wall biosynthesis
MSYVIYDKEDGKILMVKRSQTESSDFGVSGVYFDNLNTGVWHTDKKISNIKNAVLLLNGEKEPVGLSIYGVDKFFDRRISKTPNGEPFKVNYKGVFFDHGGYANMNREVALRLGDNVNINLNIEVVPSANQIDPNIKGRLMQMSLDDNSDSLFNIIGFTPMHTNPFGYNIFYTMMETETLSPMFADLCNKFSDAIFTPTQWNKKVFQKGGIDKPIYVVPLGVDTDKYNDSVKKASIKCKELPSGIITDKLPSFNFITLFGWSHRKGIDVLLDAYFSRFKGDEDVGLIICSRYNGGSDKNSKLKVERDILNYMKKHNNPGKVYYYGESTDVDDMPSVLANGDCFLWTSRGEGFGLPVLECGALGMPVVSTYNSGMTEYLNDDNSYLVHTDEFVVAGKDLTCISPYYIGQLFPKLGTVCVSEFGSKMRYVYDNYSEAKVKAEVLSNDILRKYTWDICSDNIYEILNSIKGDLSE